MIRRLKVGTPRGITYGFRVAVALAVGDGGHRAPEVISIFGVIACNQTIRADKMEQSKQARAIPQVEFLRSDQFPGQANMNSRRRFVPEAGNLALLGRAYLAFGAANVFDRVEIR